MRDTPFLDPVVSTNDFGSGFPSIRAILSCLNQPQSRDCLAESRESTNAFLARYSSGKLSLKRSSKGSPVDSPTASMNLHVARTGAAFFNPSDESAAVFGNGLFLES